MDNVKNSEHCTVITGLKEVFGTICEITF